MANLMQEIKTLKLIRQVLKNVVNSSIHKVYTSHLKMQINKSEYNRETTYNSYIKEEYDCILLFTNDELKEEDMSIIAV